MTLIFNAGSELELKIIGNFPQVIDSDTEQLFEENGKMIEEDKFQSVPESGFSVKIKKSIKLTDTLSSFMTPHSPIISERLVEFLQSFSIPSYKLIPLNVYRVKELVTEKKYFIMHFYGNDILNVDFQKSTFDYLTGGAFLDKSLLKFDSFDDYMKKLNNNEVKFSIIKNAVMKPTLKNDLFFLGLLRGSATFITQPLKEAMEKEKITGFKFVEIGHVED